MHLGDMTIQCPIVGCDQFFSNKEMFNNPFMSRNLYDLHMKKPDENGKWSKCIGIRRVPEAHDKQKCRCRKHEKVRGTRLEESDSPIRKVKKKKTKENEEETETPKMNGSMNGDAVSTESAKKKKKKKNKAGDED